MTNIKLGEVISSAKSERCGNRDFPILSITKDAGVVLQNDKFKKRIASTDTENYKIVPYGKLIQGIHIDEANFGIQSVATEGIVSPAYKVWDVKTDKILPRYLELILRSPKSIRYYSSKFNGSVKRRERITDRDFLAMDIPYVSLKEQERIIEIISKTQNIIHFQRNLINKTDDLIKARFVELFGDPEINDKKWDEACIGDNCFVTKLAGFEYTNYIHYQESGDVVMVKAQNVKNGKLNRKDLSFISNEVSDSLPRSQLAPGDIVMTYVGANIGDVAIIDDEYKYHLAPNVAKIRPNAGIYNSIFFMHLLMMKTDYIMRNSADTAKAALGMERIRKLKVFVPDIALQIEFSDFVKQVDKSKSAVRKSLEETQLLFDSLMQKYFG